jgi:hypothetical protein
MKNRKDVSTRRSAGFRLRLSGFRQPRIPPLLRGFANPEIHEPNFD